MSNYPSYLNISKGEFNRRIQKAYSMLEDCHVCPRACNVNRLEGELGTCKVGKELVVSSYHPHFGEESVLVGSHGSGTIFLTLCNLKCVFCQNYDVSQLGVGNKVSEREFAEMMISLQNKGCHNINFVSPTSYVPMILKALPIAVEKGLNVPLVYNTNAYDSVDLLKLLDGVIDVYMPDVKYSDDEIAVKLSSAPNYFSFMKLALKEMHRQVGDLEVGEDGVARRGLLVRHLVLPEGLAGTEEIMDFLVNEISPNTFVNVMDQYRPCFKAHNMKKLSRPITKEEYSEALNIAKRKGIKRFSD